MSEFDYHGGGGSDEDLDDDGMLQMTQVYDHSEDRTKRYHQSLDLAEDMKTERKPKHSAIDVEQQNIQFKFGETLTLKSSDSNHVKIPDDYNPFPLLEQLPTKKTSLIDQIMLEQRQKFDKKFGTNNRQQLNADQRAQVLGEMGGAA